MKTTDLSTLSNSELRDRLHELTLEHQRLITHGDVVSRADCREQIDAVMAKLRGQSAPEKRDENFFTHESRKAPAGGKTDFRDTVAEAKSKGLIRAPGESRAVEKNGRDVGEQRLGVRSQWHDVTPEIAQRWLENNFRNRPVSDDLVAAYARDMAAGQWVATHQGIAFNDRDELIDGQHRLLAIVRSGVNIRMMVTFGLPSVIAGKEMTTMDCVDRGRTRSVADQLKIQHGFKDAGVTAAICAAVASICCGERTRRLSVGQTLEVFRAFEEEIKWVIEHRARAAGLRSAGVLAGFVFALGGVRVREMFQQLNGAEDLPAGSAIGHLRTFLLSDEAKLFTPTLNRGLAELTMQAIYLEQRGKPVTKLEVALQGCEQFRRHQKDRVPRIAALFHLPQ